MKEQMTFESSKIENPPSPYNKVMRTIDILLKDYSGGDKKLFLTEKMSDLYGKDLALEIIGAFPEEFFKEQDKEIETKQAEKEKTKETIIEIESLPPDKKEEAILNILEKEHNVPKEKIEEARKTKNWFKLFHSLTTVVAITIAVLLIKNKEKKENLDQNKKESEKEVSIEIDSTEVNKESDKENTINYNERFNTEVYNSLPDQAKDIYKGFAEKSPTPGRGYQILDKINAINYIFNSENELVAQIPAGFGKDAGDEPNTSKEYNQGKTTTPAGVYLMSNSIDTADIIEYGKLQYSLYGVSILGNNVFLGQHQTYNSKDEEFKKRTKWLDSKKPGDNSFSDGCINIRPEDFVEYVKPYFKGDNSELLFVLQDKISKKSGAVFNYEMLVQQIFPLMLEMANQEENIYEKSISSLKDMINKELGHIADLQNQQNDLTTKYNKNTENNILQNNIHSIKELIKEKRNIIGEKRKELGFYDKKMKDLEIRRSGIEETLLSYNME